jgi:hypothetical protein
VFPTVAFIKIFTRLFENFYKEKNTLAYLASGIMTKKESFLVAKPEANIIKNFCPSFTYFRTKLECLLD